MLQGDMPSLRLIRWVAEGHPFDATWAYGSNDRIMCSEANYYGKKFLRMAGIVQMLHAFKPPSDNYVYAHPKRIRTVQQTRIQRRLNAIA